jgi:hypothetical protein
MVGFLLGETALAAPLLVPALLVPCRMAPGDDWNARNAEPLSTKHWSTAPAWPCARS